MRRARKALLLFALGSLGALTLALGVRIAAVQILGERLYRLPNLQLERLTAAFRQNPVSAAKVLVLGDSTATFSVDASRLDDAENFSLVNSTTVESYYLLRRLLRAGARPRCVLAAYSFQWEANRAFFWTMFVAGGFYSDEELAEIEGVREGFGENEPAFVRAAKRFAARKGWLDFYTSKRFQEILFYWKWNEHQLRTSRMFFRHARGSVAMRDATNFEGSLDLFYASPPRASRTELSYLSRTLALAREHGISFYYLYPPFAESVPPVKTGAYREAYEHLIEDAGGPFRFLAPPAMPDNHYLSAGHLNLQGIIAVTPELRQGLRNCYN